MNAVIDVDEFLWDVRGLVQGVCRGVVGDKVQLPEIDGLRHIDMAGELLANTKRRTQAIQKFRRTLNELTFLVRPRISGIRLVTGLREAGLRIVLITACVMHHSGIEEYPVPSVAEEAATGAQREFGVFSVLPVRPGPCDEAIDYEALACKAPPAETIVFSNRPNFLEALRKRGYKKVGMSKATPNRHAECPDCFDWKDAGFEERSQTFPPKVQPDIDLPSVCEERKIWKRFHRLPEPRPIVTGVTIKGFGRGSSDLGIPTANLGEVVVENPTAKVMDRENTFGVAELEQTKGLSLVPGVYFGYASFLKYRNDPTQSDKKGQFRVVLSCGYNPYYGNSEISLEVHLFGYKGASFLGEKLVVDILGMLRAESNFVVFGHLVQAIQNDCEVAREILAAEEAADV